MILSHLFCTVFAEKYIYIYGGLCSILLLQTIFSNISEKF